ncbi:hypothetical protein [Paenibacillus sp. NPDC057967]
MILVLASSHNQRTSRSRKSWGRFVAYALGALFAEFIRGAFGR